MLVQEFGTDVEVTGASTPTVSGWLEVQVVGGELLHSKKNGDGAVMDALGRAGGVGVGRAFSNRARILRLREHACEAAAHHGRRARGHRQGQGQVGFLFAEAVRRAAPPHSGEMTVAGRKHPTGVARDQTNDPAAVGAGRLLCALRSACVVACARGGVHRSEHTSRGKGTPKVRGGGHDCDAHLSMPTLARCFCMRCSKAVMGGYLGCLPASRHVGMHSTMWSALMFWKKATD